MSAISITYIYCDGEGCDREEPFSADVGPTEKAAQQRRHFAIHGWRYIKGKDYCPQCVAKMEAARRER